jgi:hypothetical protein
VWRHAHGARVLKWTCKVPPRDAPVERGVCSAALPPAKQTGGPSGPSRVPPAGEAHWHCLLRARAIETQSYVLAAAQVGMPVLARAPLPHAPAPASMHARLAGACACVSLSPALSCLHPVCGFMPAPRPPACGHCGPDQARSSIARPHAAARRRASGRAGCERPAARRRSAGTTRGARATGTRWRWTRGARWWARSARRRRASASCAWTTRGCATCARPCPWRRTGGRAAPAWAGARRAASRGRWCRLQARAVAGAAARLLLSRGAPLLRLLGGPHSPGSGCCLGVQHIPWCFRVRAWDLAVTPPCDTCWPMRHVGSCNHSKAMCCCSILAKALQPQASPTTLRPREPAHGQEARLCQGRALPAVQQRQVAGTRAVGRAAGGVAARAGRALAARAPARAQRVAVAGHVGPVAAALACAAGEGQHRTALQRCVSRAAPSAACAHTTGSAARAASSAVGAAQEAWAARKEARRRPRACIVTASRQASGCVGALCPAAVPRVIGSQHLTSAKKSVAHQHPPSAGSWHARPRTRLAAERCLPSRPRPAASPGGRAPREATWWRST